MQIKKSDLKKLIRSEILKEYKPGDLDGKKLESSVIKEIKKLYDLYKKEYINHKENEKKQIDTHIKVKFQREDDFFNKFLNNPTTNEALYNLGYYIFGSNEGNRYPNVKKIIDKADNLIRKVSLK